MKKTIIRQGQKAEIKTFALKTEKSLQLVYEICITTKDTNNEEILIYFYVPELTISNSKP